MNEDQHPQTPGSEPSLRLPDDSSAGSPSTRHEEDARRKSSRPSIGAILGGVAVGLVGAPIAGFLLLLLVVVVTQDHVTAGSGLFLGGSMFGIWYLAGWMTAAFARTTGARVGLALLFGLGYGIFPFAVIFAICGR